MDSSSSSSSKRAKAPNMNQPVVSCLVDGCESDLTQCRDYHRRHKVCEPHSKTPIVTIAGHHQRFCQQCSRFHSLEEFDEGKRSCRKRLDGHNRRRRKPPLSDSLPRSSNTSSGVFFSTPQGSRIVSFGSSPEIHGNPGSNSGMVFQPQFPISSGLGFMQSQNQISNRSLFCDGGVRALSLLSSSSSYSQARDMQYGHGGVGVDLGFHPQISHGDDQSNRNSNRSNNHHSDANPNFNTLFQDDGSSSSDQTRSFGW